MVKKDIPLKYGGARIPISMTNLKTWVTITSATRKDIKHMTAGLGLSEHQDFKVTATIGRSMDIELLSVDQSLCGHLISLQEEPTMHITTTGITTLGIAVTIVRSMDTFLKIA